MMILIWKRTSREKGGIYFESFDAVISSAKIKLNPIKPAVEQIDLG